VGVLIVDDEDPLRAAIATLLQDEGYAVQEAQNGEEALDVLRAAAEPMVVVLDWMMPIMDGVAVLQAARDDPARLGHHAYILVSALPRTRHADLADLLTALSVRTLPKPFDITALLDEVDVASQRLHRPHPESPQE
jgi:CheY-like chemotaxis protein